MKGLVGGGIIKVLAIIILAVTLFGGNLLDFYTAGARCVMSTGSADFNCNDLGYVAGKTVVVPDRNIQMGVISLLEHDDYSDVVEDSPTLSRIHEGYTLIFKLLIIAGVAGTIILLLLPTIFFYKGTPSTKTDAGALGLCIMAGFLLVIVLQLGFTGIIEGEAEMPFTGMVMLIQHPDVLWKVVDETSALPSTMESDDIFDNTSVGSIPYHNLQSGYK